MGAHRGLFEPHSLLGGDFLSLPLLEQLSCSSYNSWQTRPSYTAEAEARAAPREGSSRADGVPNIVQMALLRMEPRPQRPRHGAEDLLWTQVRGQRPVVVRGLIIVVPHGWV